MLTMTEELLKNLECTCDGYEKYHLPMQADVYENLPDIQRFIEQLLMMLGDASMQQEVMDILQDMLSALQQKDDVLLYDAVKYGLMEYMKAVIEILGEE